MILARSDVILWLSAEIGLCGIGNSVADEFCISFLPGNFQHMISSGFWILWFHQIMCNVNGCSFVNIPNTPFCCLSHVVFSSIDSREKTNVCDAFVVCVSFILEYFRSFFIWFVISAMYFDSICLFENLCGKRCYMFYTCTCSSAVVVIVCLKLWCKQDESTNLFFPLHHFRTEGNKEL